MAFEKQVPEWKATGSEPPSSLKESGFTTGYKPPAAYFNWFWHGVSECLKELQELFTGAEESKANADLSNVTNEDLQAKLDEAGISGGGIPIVNATSTDGVAYTATCDAISELTNGTMIIFVPDRASASTAPKLDLNGTGACTIRRRLSNGSSTNVAGASNTFIGKSKPSLLMYDTNTWVILEMPKPNASDIYGKVPVRSGGWYADSSTTESEKSTARNGLNLDYSVNLNQGIPTFKTYAHRAMLYANGKYISVGGNGIEYSENGISWVQTNAAQVSWYSVAYGNGKYVTVVLNSNKAAYSSDGITWTETTLPKSAYWYTVAYCNGVFVAGNSNGEIARSTDGMTWESSVNDIGSAVRTIFSSNDKFIALSDTGVQDVRYSTDGITWSEASGTSTSSAAFGAYGNGRYVALRKNSTQYANYYSDDGITWTAGNTISGMSECSGVCYGNGKFVAISENSNIVAYSSDGITWATTTMPNSNYTAIAFDGSKFIAAKTDYNYKGAAFSFDGITWTEGVPFFDYPNGTDITEQVKDVLNFTPEDIETVRLYRYLEALDLTAATATTDAIMKAMESNSMALLDVSTSWTAATEIPSKYATMLLFKRYDGRTSGILISVASEHIWFGSQHSGGSFAGWKELAPYSYGTTDLTAGSSSLATGKVHYVYE